LQSRGWRQGAQNKNASHDLSKVVIGRYEAFGVQLAERDMQCPLVRPDLSKTVQREIDALTETDSRGASEQERMLAATPVLTNIQHPTTNIHHPTYCTSSSTSIPKRSRTLVFSSAINAHRSRATPPPAL